MKSELPVKFEPAELLKLPIELPPEPPAKKNKKHKTAMADVAAFARFGVQVLRIKAQTLAALGKVAEEAGIRQIGHGKILLASDNAEQAIQTLGAFVEELKSKPGGADHKTIVELMRLVQSFNGQLIQTAQAHLQLDKHPANGTTEARITMPFPSGSPVMIAVGKPQAAVEQENKPA